MLNGLLKATLSFDVERTLPVFTHSTHSLERSEILGDVQRNLLFSLTFSLYLCIQWNHLRHWVMYSSKVLYPASYTPLYGEYWKF
jgi:hypothetical protein